MVSSAAGSSESDTAVQTAHGGNVVTVGLATRVLSWGIDLLIINFVATTTGLFVALIISIFPITKSLQPVFAAIAGGVYILWTAAYFVVFWSMTGQTLGARVMQVRLVTPGGDRVKPVRALVRWFGMNLGMLPLPWGYVPIPFKRRGFPDWLARTRVIDVDAEQLSIAAQRQETLRRAAATNPRATAAPPVEAEMPDDPGMNPPRDVPTRAD
jgi:uncharacterized RDD family membrane protein YckC